MFQIFDCNGRAVGRPAGYARHAVAVGIAERRGRIKSELRAACDAAPARADGRQLLYRVAELPAGRRGYLSFSGGLWRVVVQALPVCADKATPAEALAAARQLAVELAPAAWNGDRGEWVWLETIAELEGGAA